MPWWAGANPNTTTEECYGKADRIHELFQNRHYFPLFVASTRNNLPALRALLDGKADVNMRTLRHTALFTSCKLGHEACARLLLERKADPELVHPDATKMPVNALMASAAEGRVTCAQLLLEWKANIDYATNPGNMTSLIAACYRNRVNTVRVLLDAKANASIRSTTKEGYTALETARDAGHEEVVNILWAAGVRV